MTHYPYPGSRPTPDEQAGDLNRLLTYLRTFALRRSFPWVAIWVWHSRVSGRSPHPHIFMHCPKRYREELHDKLNAIYPEAGMIDARDGSDIRKLHHQSGYWGSTLDYLMRFMSQQAFVANGGRTWRESITDENGRHVGVKSPITGKRWGCTRNISPRAIDLHLATKAEARAAAISATRKAA